MSFVGDAIGDIFGGITGAKQAGEGAVKAGEIQAASSAEGIAEQRRQFDSLIELMSPFVETGTQALEGQQGILGLQGTEAQQQAISGIEGSPIFQALTQQGENAILQNASAIGGLRGGNVKGALAQFRPQILNQLLESQYQKLGGLSQLGQASAAGQASAGLQTGTNISNLLGQAGAARAGGAIGQAGAVGQTFGDLTSLGGAIAGGF